MRARIFVRRRCCISQIREAADVSAFERLHDPTARPGAEVTRIGVLLLAREHLLFHPHAMIVEIAEHFLRGDLRRALARAILDVEPVFNPGPCDFFLFHAALGEAGDEFLPRLGRGVAWIPGLDLARERRVIPVLALWLGLKRYGFGGWGSCSSCSWLDAGSPLRFARTSFGELPENV